MTRPDNALKPEEGALIWSPEEEGLGLTVLMPDIDPRVEAPEGLMLLMAVAMRLAEDPEFRVDMLQWFTEEVKV